MAQSVKGIVSYRKYREISIVMMLVFIILFMLPKILIRWIEPGLLNFRILPVIWGGFIFAFFRFVPRVHPVGRISKLENIYLESIVCATLLTGIRFLAASMIGGLGESPYLVTPAGIMNNLLFVLPLLIARELIRSYALGSFCIKPNARAFILITAVITLCDLNYATLMLSENLEEVTIYLAEEFGPILCQNILLSYLALYGGAVASLSYLAVITLFHWMSPILPSLNWLAEGAIGIIVPIFYLTFIIKKYETQSYHSKLVIVKKGDALKWVATALFSIGLIWFVVGVFPLKPSVIATGSMEPLIHPGDIVIMRQVRTEDQVRSLKAGDIIQFERDHVRITHRITEIESDKLSNLTFHTKGDNNTAEDVQTVDPNDIRGTFVYVIPKLGIPTLLMKGELSEIPEDVAF